MTTLLKYLIVFNLRKFKYRLTGLEPTLASALACDGQTETEELRLLSELATQVRSADAIIEIGSFRGRSTVALALGAQTSGATVFAVDPYVPIATISSGTNLYHDYSARDREICLTNLLVSGASRNTRCLHLDSQQAANKWNRDQPVGLLFIDGDHLYESAKRDFDCWYPHVRQSGWIAFHDSVNPEWGSAKFVSELRQSKLLEEVSVIKGTTVFKKTAPQ